ncbi:MAG TPA: energy transducer TonB [Candidatus Angelobacter sp.]
MALPDGNFGGLYTDFQMTVKVTVTKLCYYSRMRTPILLCLLWVTASIAFAQKRNADAMPNEFVLGRHTFFDFGPPFNYYDLFVVRDTGNGVSIENILLTPSEGSCQPAKIEIRSALVKGSVASLLSGNPCTIPDKKLHRELKRCKHCPVFSGADVAMELQCGSGTRIIRSAVLDRDWFDQHPGTPQHTLQTMELLAKLEQATGPGPLDKPVFPVSGETKLDDVAAGKYDALFQTARPSEIYRAAQKTPHWEPVRLVSSLPMQPQTYIEPEYPQMARIAHIEGTALLKLQIGPAGDVTSSVCTGAHPILCASAKDAASKWKFPTEILNRKVDATLRFTWNCGEQN